MPVIHPPSHDEQILKGIAYLFTAGIGASTLIWPYPTFIGDQIGAAAVAWSIAMLMAIPAAMGSFTGRYRIEYAALPMFTVSLFVANVAVWINIIFATADTTVVPRACASSALIFLLAWRWRQLHRLIRILQWKTPQPPTR